MASNGNVNSFGTYLETVLSPSVPEQSPAAQTPALGMAPVLQALSVSGPQKMSDLLSVSGLDLQSYAALVQTMQNAKLITVVGDASEQTVDLTPEGKALAQHST